DGVAALPAGVAIPCRLAGLPADDVDRRKVGIAQTIAMTRRDLIPQVPVARNSPTRPGSFAPVRVAAGRARGLRVRYSMSSSARNATDCGIAKPKAFAVFRLMTNSNFVGCSTGKSAGA